MMLKTEAVTYRAVLKRESEDRIDLDAVNISIYEHEVPGFVADEMDRLYGNLYASVNFLTLTGRMNQVNTYVVRKGGRATTILLFRLEGAKVEVLNEVIELNESDIGQFVTIVFSRFQDAEYVSFRSIWTTTRALPVPFQKINCLEDIVVSLPSSEKQYLASLSKGMRRNLSRYEKKLLLEFPEMKFDIHMRDEISDQMIEDIVNLNKARMKGKNKVSAIDRKDVVRLIALVKTCGLVCVASLNGKVCGGAISFRIGENHFLNVLAHDSQYNALGIICCNHLIAECITRGAREFHFLWGRYDYKYQFLGVRRDLDVLVVYRSRLHVLLNSDTALKVLFEGKLRQFKLWLQEAKRNESPAFIAANRLMNRLRGLVQFKLNFSAGEK